MKKLIFTSIFTTIVTILSYGQNCNCELNFKWLKNVMETNDAGFQYAIETKGIDAYNSLNKITLDSIKTINNIEQCYSILSNWLKFFRKGHLRLSLLKPSEKKTDVKKPHTEILSFDEKNFSSHLDSLKTPGLEGIWELGQYKIGIIKENKIYTGFIIASKNPAWNQGEVKLKISKNNSAVFYLGDKSIEQVAKINLLSENYLQIGSRVLKRVYPWINMHSEKDDYYSTIYAPEPFLKKINEKTILLRIPTFNLSQKQKLDSVILANKDLLSHSENLIIDIRDNGGGSDKTYADLIPYLYTNPIRIIGTALYSTKQNNKMMLAFATHPAKYGFSETFSKEANDNYKALEQNLGKFVNLHKDSLTILNQYQTLEYPKNIGLIINQNNGSAAEQFILAAKQSKKVKLFGTTTAGVLDISNMWFTDSPCKEFKLWYSLSKSYRIPEFAIDGKGIQPDYFIDKSIPNEKWILFVSNTLNGN